MRYRKWVLVFLAVMALGGATIAATMAAPRSQTSDEAQSTEAESHNAPGAQSHPQRPSLGMAVTELNPGVREALGLPDDLEGVVVMAVVPQSPAAEAGMQRGDVVMGALGHTVTTPAELHELLAVIEPGDPVTLVVWRNGETHRVIIETNETIDHEERPGKLPAWLRKLHGLVNHFPNLVDGDIRVVDDEGVTHTFGISLGQFVGFEGNVFGIEMKNGEAVRFELGDDAIVIKAGQRAELSDLETGDRVVVLEKDGVVKVVLAGPFQRPRPRPHLTPGQERPDARSIRPQRPDRPDRDAPGRDAIEQRLREALENLRERFGDSDLRPEIQERLEQIQKRLEEMSGRLGRLEGFHVNSPAETTGQVV